MTWRSDVALLCDMAEKDKRLLDRLGKHLRAEEKEILEAIVRSHGDPKSLAEQLGPIAIARLKARGVSVPQRVREPAAQAWKILQVPLKMAWRPPAKPTPQKLAQAFLDNYGARLATLSTDAKAVDKAVGTLAECLRSVGATKDLLGLAQSLQSEVKKLEAVATSCTHAHHDAGKWATDCAQLTRESAQTLQMVRSLGERLNAMGDQLDELAGSVREWVEAKPIDRAKRAEAMAVRMKAASDVVASMREDFLAAVFGN